ncbi:hypothetical protein CcNV_104 [Crangon crangon nudivirus]|uniref:Uncharacterized protein n=1 Tax=Crangon crangon nudivirus TaxID=2880838 RepID=A0AAE9BYS4_9VIRU|nr:hypothetical protein QKT25_gp105 [Crangon crangon nudivirus]UBZ25589.1 hypothetical protein CcNV_104 [Crangon crangon nudivirus]
MNRTEDTYNRLRILCPQKSNLQSLYALDKILFDPEFIEAILNIVQANEYTLFDFTNIIILLQSSLFYDFMKSNLDNDKAKGFDSLFDMYFNLITNGKSISGNGAKIKICALLKMTLTIPVYNQSLSFKNTQINVATSYRPQEIQRATASCDIANIVQQSFFAAIQDVPVEVFSYRPYSSTMSIQGPILQTLMNNLLALQDHLLQTAISCNVKVEPFIVNTSSIKAI